jgi:hypothetical protein
MSDLGKVYSFVRRCSKKSSIFKEYIFFQIHIRDFSRTIVTIYMEELLATGLLVCVYRVETSGQRKKVRRAGFRAPTVNGEIERPLKAMVKESIVTTRARQL